MQILLQNKNRVRLRCGRTVGGKKCGAPLVILSLRHVHFSGKHGLGRTEEGKLMIHGCCPSCGGRYEITDPEGLIPDVPSPETPNSASKNSQGSR